MVIKSNISSVAVSAIGLLLLLFALAGPASAELIQDFSATGQGQQVYIQWNTADERAVSSFKIQRSFDGKYFHNLTTISPTGSNSSYSYIDSDLFKGSLQTFYYRIEVGLRENRTEYSATERVELAFSGIRKTWGSIKAMFR